MRTRTTAKRPADKPVPKLHQPMTPEQSRLASDNLGLAFAMARKFSGKGIDDDELLSLAQEALCRAAKCYERDRGFKFSTYACRAIVLGFAAKLGRMNNGAKLVKFPQSLDQYRDGDERQHMADIADRRPGLSERMSNGELYERAMACLDERQRTVILLRYQMNWTLEEIGDTLGVTKERARQIQQEALSQCREALGEAA
jgi:RNA polymerase sigma factor (sigma-70 family)